jgi:hypothetical protein
MRIRDYTPGEKVPGQFSQRNWVVYIPDSIEPITGGLNQEIYTITIVKFEEILCEKRAHFVRVFLEET